MLDNQNKMSDEHEHMRFGRHIEELPGNVRQLLAPHAFRNHFQELHIR
jgi:hypothetical protein